MKISYVAELNAFMRYARNECLTGRERLLWIALFNAANERALRNAMTKDQDWPGDFFPVANGEINLNSTLDKRAIEATRNSLKQRGLIDFRPGSRNKKNPEYRLFYLSNGVGHNFVPNGVPNNAPNGVPNTSPTMYPTMAPYIDIDKIRVSTGEEENKNSAYHQDGGADDSSEGKENAWGLEFRIAEFRKADDETKKVMAEAAQKLFADYSGRSATATDQAILYGEIAEYDFSSGARRLNAEKLAVIRYAFEQAFLKGCPGNWKYILGCCSNLYARGIRTGKALKDSIYGEENQ